MAYVRKGMGIRDLAYLGRWKSSVVLTYAEEALETTPANRGLGTQILEAQAAPKTPSRIMLEPVMKETPNPRHGQAAGGVLGDRPKVSALWHYG